MLHERIAPPPGAMPHFGRDARFRKLVTLFERDEIGAAVDCLIAYMDAQQGDIDREDATGVEDAFEDHSRQWNADPGPGCPIADAGGTESEDEDDDADTSAEDDPRGFDPEEDRDDSDREAEAGDCGVDAQQIDPVARRRHRDRIRRTACDVKAYRNPFDGHVRREYRLRDPYSIAINI